MIFISTFSLIGKNDRNVKQSNEHMTNDNVFATIKNDTKGSTEPISCGCPELATWHPGQVEHKAKCLSLTMIQFMAWEGFP